LQIDWHSLIFCFSCDAQQNFWTVRRSLSRNLYGRYSKVSKFQNFEYEVHQVGSKYYRSQNFSCIAFKRTELVSRQISATAATARDRRNFFIAQNMLFYIKSPKKWKSANFYFPHMKYWKYWFHLQFFFLQIFTF
jgi:hypothetical protein